MKSPSPSRLSNAVKDEAALWAVRLKGGVMTAADRAELDTWLAHDLARRTLLATYCQFSADLERQLPAVVDTGVAMPAETAGARSRWWRTIPAAAGLAAAIALGFGAWATFGRERPATFSTAAVQRQTITLADGTRADLNAQTTLRIDFRDRSERLVHLEDGEALFTVAKNPERPFIVETAGGRVRVTGTIFNLRADASGHLEVSVLEGSVEVAPHAENLASRAPLRLAQGDQIALVEGHLAVRRDRPEVATEAAAWRDGQIVFDSLPLGEALERFTAYHGRAITVAPEVAHLRIGGRYSLDDLKGFLDALERVVPVRVERSADGKVRIVGSEP